MIELFKYMFLGFVQGFTETIPVSSSGHLMIFKTLMDVKVDFDTIAILTNFGSLLAIIVLFRNDIPAGVAGLIVSKLDLFDKIEKNIKIVGLSLMITAILLYIIRNFRGHKKDEDLTVKDALAVGCFQILGLFPGISRSGSTIVGGMFSDLKRDTAFKYSFMLYIPMSLAAMALEITEINFDKTLIGYYIISIIQFIVL